MCDEGGRVDDASLRARHLRLFRRSCPLSLSSWRTSSPLPPRPRRPTSYHLQMSSWILFGPGASSLQFYRVKTHICFGSLAMSQKVNRLVKGAVLILHQRQQPEPEVFPRRAVGTHLFSGSSSSSTSPPGATLSLSSASSPTQQKGVNLR